MQIPQSSLLGLVLGLFALVSVAPLLAQESTPDRSGATAQADEEEEGPLHTAMERIQKGMRPLGRSLRSPETVDVALQAVEDMRVGLVAALACTPDFPEDLTEPTGRKLHRIAFQRKLAATLDVTLQLEEALLLGDPERALTLFGDLRAHKQEGHKRFQLDEDEH